MSSDQKTRLAIVLWIVAGGGLYAVSASGQQPATHQAGAMQGVHGVHVPIKREVIALSATKCADRSGPTLDYFHEILQMPLNHLGIIVREHDLTEGPPEIDPHNTRAVATYFQGDEARPPWLWPWLEEAHRLHGLRVVHFGDFGPLAFPTDGRLRSWLARFGLALDPGYVGDPLRIQLAQRDPKLCAYESRPVYERVHRGPRSLAADNDVWVTTFERGSASPPRTPVVTGPWGGIALQPWALRDAADGERRWYIDPFRFFADALGLRGVPAPDPCVLNGRRLFILHIDGDGFESTSTVRPGTLSGRVMYDDVLARYRLPATVSVIVASVTKDFTPNQPTPEMVLARQIFREPYVEVASHSVLHPLNWRRRLTKRTAPRTVVWYPELAHYTHDMVAEVRESIRFINDQLCEGDKKCQLMLWSGKANPTEEAVRAATEQGCLNLNGGVYRWDATRNSASYVSPWGKQVGDAFQVYCGAANENVFDGFFSTMPHAYGHVDTTIEAAGRGRILKPANLYIHFYSAERPARLRALHRLIERWAFSEPTAPVFASTYVRAVLAAQRACRVDRTPGGWAFRSFDHCRTARIDGETRAIDWARSRGLIGAKRMNDALFVHLGDADAQLVWSTSPGAARPHVESANHALHGVVLAADGVELTTAALTRRELVLAGFPPAADLVIDLDGEVRSRRADLSGRLEFMVPEPGHSRLKVRVR